MHDSSPNVAGCFRYSLLMYEWWGILQVSPGKIVRTVVILHYNEKAESIIDVPYQMHGINQLCIHASESLKDTTTERNLISRDI